jgi:sugar/nucleoside kinase (ribokinase family)
VAFGPVNIVFREDLEKYAACNLDQVFTRMGIRNLLSERNIGGPAIVALASASQIALPAVAKFAFFQSRGDDANGDYIAAGLRKYAPAVNLDHYRMVQGTTAETTVLSDPWWDDCAGERTFIHTVGTAGSYDPGNLPSSFFEGDILLFGATALTPNIHVGLGELLRRGRREGRFNIVSTVFDFISENRSPSEPWPMGDGTDSYRLIDLLVADKTEALRLSGADSVATAAGQFMRWGLSALIVTNGTQPVTFYATEDSCLFHAVSVRTLPAVGHVAGAVIRGEIPYGDTTGCGDNFAGGVLASIIDQLRTGDSRCDLAHAVILGCAAGASACYHCGGLTRQKFPGEKRNRVNAILERYRNDLEKDRSHHSVKRSKVCSDFQ